MFITLQQANKFNPSLSVIKLLCEHYCGDLCGVSQVCLLILMPTETYRGIADLRFTSFPCCSGLQVGSAN